MILRAVQDPERRYSSRLIPHTLFNRFPRNPQDHFLSGVFLKEGRAAVAAVNEVILEDAESLFGLFRGLEIGVQTIARQSEGEEHTHDQGKREDIANIRSMMIPNVTYNATNCPVRH